MHTNYFIDLIMGNVFGSKTDPSIPTKYYVGLSKTTPSVNGTGVTEPSVSGTGYSRVPIDTFAAPQNGVVTNTSAVSFDESLSSWGVVTHYVVFDTQTVGSGNLLFFGALNGSKTIDANSLTLIRANEIQLSLSNK